MSEVISPNPGNAVIVTDSHNHDRNSETRDVLRHQETRDAARDAELRTSQREILASVAFGSKDAAVGFKDGLVTAYQVEGRGLLEAAKNAAALGVQAEKLASASILQGEKLAAAAMLAAQECCCEIKELIRSDGEKTRDLISANTLQDQRDRASKAENAYMALFTSKVAPVTPAV